MQKKLAQIVLWVKKTFHVQTYIVEYVFVGAVLVIIAIVSHKGLVEWLGVVAVFLTFGHASIAERLQEREAKRYHIDRKVEVECYWKLNYYFYAKEFCWLVYFYLLGAWSALAGVFIFLLYPLWRKTWRKYQPIK